MLGDQLSGVLLIAGIVLIGLGVLVGIVVAVVAIVRRQRAAEPAEAARLGETFAGTTGTAADEVPFSIATDAERAAGRGAEPGTPWPSVDPGSSSPFVASRPADAAASTAPPSPPAPPAPPAPPVPPAPPPPPSPSAWSEIIAAADSGPSDELGTTTSSFAPPGGFVAHSPTVAPHADTVPQPIVEPASPAELTSPPLVNPWLGTGPQPPAPPPPPESSDPATGEGVEPATGFAPPPPPPEEPEPTGSAEPESTPPATQGTETVPTVVVERVPLAAPAPPPSRAERDDGLADAAEPSEAAVLVPPLASDEEDRTVLVGRPERIPWLLVLDTGERIDIPAESVVLGRKPASIEHGVPGIRVPDSTKTISKVHARLDRVGEHWTLTDLGSTNGSSVIAGGGREQPLPSGGSEPVRGRFLLGEVGMILVRNPESPAS